MDTKFIETDIEALKSRLEREKEHQRTVNCYHRIFNSEDGKIILSDIQKAFATELPAFVTLDKGNSVRGYDSTHAAIRDGQRSVLLHIQAKLNAPIKGDANIEKPKAKVRRK